MTPEFRKISAQYILGLINEVKLEGPSQNVYAINNVLETSRKLYNALNEDNANFENIVCLIHEKSQAAQNLEKITGIKWLF